MASPNNKGKIHFKKTETLVKRKTKKKSANYAYTFLKKNKLNFESLFRMIPGHVYWADKDNVYLGCNNEQAACLLLESGQEIIGKTAFDFFDEKTAILIDKKDKKVMREGKVVITEEPVIWPNGQKGTYLSNKVPLFNTKHEVIGLLGISLDITKQKKLQQSLKKAKEKLETLYQHKIAFIRNMEHDIRTPFNILLQSATLLYEQEEDGDTKQALGFMIETIQQLIDFCNRILSLGQSQLNGLPKREKKFNLKKSIESVVSLQQHGAKHKGLNFTCDIAKNVPTYFIGDSFAIEAILIGLLSNAIKFTKAGNVSLAVKKMKELKSRKVILRFTVLDTGIGISEQDQSLLFEMFAKAHPSNINAYKGLGVGLYLIKQTIEQLEGDIEIKSKLNEGTKVLFDVPLKYALIDDCIDEEKNKTNLS